MVIEARFENGVVTRIRVGKVEIPANLDESRWPEAKEYLERLWRMGVFEESRYDVLRRFIKGLSENARRLLKSMPVDEWIPKSKLDSMTGISGRQTAGVLAEVTKAARKEGLVDPDGQIYEVKFEDGEYHYRLKPEFRDLSCSQATTSLTSLLCGRGVTFNTKIVSI